MQEAVQENPGSPATYRILAACYAHRGLAAPAREILARLRAITPAVMPAVLPWRRPEHRELLLFGLRLAMGDAGMSRTRRPAAALEHARQIGEAIETATEMTC